MRSLNYKCILCGSQDILCLFRRKEYGMFKCKGCGVLYRFPYANRAEYIKEVSEHYCRVDPYFKVAKSREKLYKRFLSRIRGIKKGESRLLDIGCGYGYFLSLAKKDGWNSYGVELVPALAKMGIQNYGLNIQSTNFEEAKFSDDYFDIITLWNIFDEFLDPLKSLLKIRRILKPGGILFLRTPNAIFHLFIYKIQQPLKKMHLNFMLRQSFIFHLFNFSNKSFRLILNNNGFKNIKIRNSPPTKGVRAFKIFTFLIAQLLFILSFGRLTVAPSIEVFAENGKD